jgi:hypothetical protein
VKLLKVWAIHLLAGDRNYSEPWFSKTHYKGYVIPRLDLFRYLIDGLDNLKIVRKVLVVLNSYKLTVLGRPSLSTIVDTPVSEPSDPYISKLRLYCHLPNVPPYALEETEVVDTRSKFADDYGNTFDGPFGMKDDSVFGHTEHTEYPRNLGKLVPIIDKGKWRNILVGHWVIQLQTKKLADWLRNWLWKLPEVASGDQCKFSDFIITAMKNGRYMMSIDLAEATDRLSRDLQIKLLISMGVPKAYFYFLKLPFVYDGSIYHTNRGLQMAEYSNGQPMGLFLSFPMFELAHYVILKFACAVSKAEFCICGDDVVIALESEKDRDKVFGRYKTLIERFGGVISTAKTIMSSRLAEGVGAIFLKGIPKDIRIPTGKLSLLEATTPDTWLYRSIRRSEPVGRSIMASWLSTMLQSSYTYDQRSAMNYFLLTKDLSDWDITSLRLLDKPEHMPQTYSKFEKVPSFWRNTPEDEVLSSRFRWIGLRRYQESLVDNKIVSLYRKDTKGLLCRKPKLSRR